jgi:hypothetical protein
MINLFIKNTGRRGKPRSRQKGAEMSKKTTKVFTFLYLKENIHAILHGSNFEKGKLRKQYFHMAETPEFMKKYGLTGDYFSVRYGVISRHIRKDKDHSLSEENWNDLCEAIKTPFAIAKYNDGFRLFTSVKTGQNYIVVGVDVKTIGRGVEVNSVSTAFSYNQRWQKKEEIIYKSKKITPEQVALLDGLNSLSLPPDQGYT